MAPSGEILIARGLIDETELLAALDEQADQGGRLGEILFQHGSVSAADLRDALTEQHGLDAVGQHRGDALPLGRLLMRSGHIDEAQLDSALAEHQRTGQRLGRILIGNGAISPFTLAAALAEQQGVATETRAIWEAAQHGSAPGQALYEVREAGDRGSHPLLVSNSFLDATDVAFSLLREWEPNGLLVVQTGEGRDVQVCWQYPPVDESRVPGDTASA